MSSFDRISCRRVRTDHPLQGHVVAHAWAMTGTQVKRGHCYITGVRNVQVPVFLGDKTTAANVRCQQLTARGDYSRAKY